MMETPEETVAVYAAPSEAMAGIVRSALEAEGIRAVVGEQVTGAYSAAFAVAEGFWGEVRVNAADVPAAKAILAAYEAGQGMTADEDAELAAQAESTSDPQV